MGSKRTWLKLLAALIALGVAFFMNSVYEKDIMVTTSIAPEDDEFINQLSTYSYKEIAKICDDAVRDKKIKYTEIVLDFSAPTPGEERKTLCPWSRGDNLEPRAGQLMSRYEQVHVASLPEKAVICSLDVKLGMGPKGFEHRDFYVLVLNGIILSTDAEFLLKFYREEKTLIAQDQEIRTYMFEWSRILGARRPSSLDEESSRQYCIGSDITLATCSPMHSQEPRFTFSDRLAQWIGARGMGPNQRYSIVVTGDKDEATDCYHSSFKIKANYGYVGE